MTKLDQKTAIPIWVFSTLVLLCPPSSCKPSDDLALYRDLQAQDQSPIDTINSFSVRNFSQHTKLQVVPENAAITISLLTPLNSEFTRAGDLVRAEVISSKLADGEVWLPKGTVLNGTVERVDKSTYGRTDASIHLSFYEGESTGKVFEITSIPSTKDTGLHALPHKATKKEIARHILMSASFIAIPLAVGTGGTSMAITVGAGAIIGGVLADNGQHVKGALNGAWEGSGLRMLDPLVKKGQSVVLPVGTQMALQLRQPALVPAEVIRQAKLDQRQQSPATLETHAALVKPVDTQETLQKCEVLLRQNNLASAIAVVDNALRSAPDDRSLLDCRKHLLDTAIGADRISTTSSPKEL